MITRDLIITVNDDVSVLNEPITLYRGDRGITLNCKIVQYKFQFMRTTDGNVITGTNIINARVLVHKPDGNGCFEVPLAKVKDDIVVIPISADWLDEISEIGTYRLQIQLYGEDPVQQRITIPPIEFTVQDTLCDIKENFTDIAGYALTDTSAIKLKGNSYNADLNNGYTPTIWVTGDIITSTSLNKMEEAIEYSVNKVNSINGVEDNDKVDYMGNKHKSLKDKADADVEYILGEVNTVHYDGQCITATDTLERQVRSAILKGCTLVNLCNNVTFSNIDAQYGFWTEIPNALMVDIIKGKKYFIRANVETNSFIDGGQALRLKNEAGEVQWTILNLNQKQGVVSGSFTAEINGTIIQALSESFSNTGSLVIKEIMIIEYQQDMENWNIPYFEGMKSVQSPKVTMVGKNLVDDTGMKQINLAQMSITNMIRLKVKPNISYYVGLTLQNNIEPSFSYFAIEYKDKNGVIIRSAYQNQIITFTEEQAKKIEFVNIFTNKEHGYSSVYVEHFWVAESDKTVPYKPYQSNILTVNENVELRGIGDVKDELNLVTGEVTQRFHKTIIDGNYEWTLERENNGFLQFGTQLTVKGNKSGELIGASNKFVYGTISSEGTQEQVLVFEHDGWITQLRLIIDSSRLETSDSEGLKKYFTKNPFELIYVQQPIIKTVDLKGQKVYSYDGTTHYATASAENKPVPTLSIDVPTNLPALVSRQRATIQALTVENQEIKAVNEAQDTEIELNQEAINFMLFHSTSMMLSEQTKGINPMSTYLANQIIRGKLSYDLVIEKYEDFKEDIDMILMKKYG